MCVIIHHILILVRQYFHRFLDHCACAECPVVLTLQNDHHKNLAVIILVSIAVNILILGL